jgi:hypothetical protein
MSESFDFGGSFATAKKKRVKAGNSFKNKKDYLMIG